MAKKKIPKKKEKITEIFEVEKKGKESEVTKKGTEEVLVEKPGQKKHQAKILRNLLIGVIIIFGIILGGYYYLDSLKHLDYEGVPFKAISEGDLIFYTTSIPVMYQGKEVPYNFYLRTKPSKLEKIPFDREGFELMKFTVFNYTLKDFDCDKDEIIAMANLNQLYKAIDAEVIKDPNATCDPEGRYTYYNLIKADKTEIEKIGDKCYNVKIANCEILPATEKIMAEIFLKLSQ